MNKQQVDTDNVCENSRQAIFNYAAGDPVYVDKTGIHLKLYYKKHGTYITTEGFKNGTVGINRGKVNEIINTRSLETQFR